MVKFGQKGVAQIVLLLIILIGIVVTVWGVQHARTILRPKAVDFDTRCPDNKCYFDSRPEYNSWIYKHGGRWEQKDPDDPASGKCVYAFDKIQGNTRIDNPFGQIGENDEDVCNRLVRETNYNRNPDQTAPAQGDRACIPGNFDKNPDSPTFCSVCNSFGTGYDTAGSDWGDKSKNPKLWCACASKYANTGDTPKQFNAKNFPECPNAKQKISCDQVGAPINPEPRGNDVQSGGTVKLTWDPADNNSQGYLVRVNQVSGGRYNKGVSFEADKGTPNDCGGVNSGDPAPYVCIKKWPDTSLNIKVQPGADYSWHVASLDEDGNACHYTSPATFTTKEFE